MILFPPLFAGIATALAFLAVSEILLLAGSRYKERFLVESSTELDDMLLQLPANRLLDLCIALAVLIALGIFLLLMIKTGLSFLWDLTIGIGAGILVFPAPRLLLRYLKKRRLNKFNLQLEDALGMISSSLKAGFSINQALDEVANLQLHPLAVEFRLLTQELQLGVPFEQALENMNRRIGSDDFELVVSAILTARQTGGELTGALERVAALIRERVRISNKVQAVTAMGRLQALMIGAMPFLLMWAMFYITPQMMENFFNSAAGWIALGLMCILDVCGFLVIRKITTIEV